MLVIPNSAESRVREFDTLSAARSFGPAYPSQWAAIGSIASKIGCAGETLRKWVRQAERNQGCCQTNANRSQLADDDEVSGHA